MTTKEQERKALEQIRKIVAELGEGSYIATALDGMFEDAEENIENDFALSWKDRAQTAERRLSELTTDYNRQICEMSTRRAEAETHAAAMEETAQNRGKELDIVKQARDEWKTAYNKAQAAATEAEVKVEELETEIIRLKAKLYDLIVKE